MKPAWLRHEVNLALIEAEGDWSEARLTAYAAGIDLDTASIETTF